jgi:hypothetical protein
MPNLTDFVSVERYVPNEDPPDSDVTTWQNHNHTVEFTSPPECSLHHTYRETVPIEEFEIWVCPWCGQFSDAYTSHSGGTHLVQPANIDAEDVIIATGRECIPPSLDTNSLFGDGTMRAVLLTSAFAAKDDINAFSPDTEHPGPSVEYSRWVPELKRWVVHSGAFQEFVEYMADRGWVVIDLPNLQPE